MAPNLHIFRINKQNYRENHTHAFGIYYEKKQTWQTKQKLHQRTNKQTHIDVLTNTPTWTSAYVNITKEKEEKTHTKTVDQSRQGDRKNILRKVYVLFWRVQSENKTKPKSVGYKEIHSQKYTHTI